MAPVGSVTKKVEREADEKKANDPFFSDQILEGETMFYRDSIKSLSALNFPTDKIKARLRTVISKQLAGGFAIPEIVEGLVEFLIDVVKEDPAQGRLLGVYD